MRLLGREVVMEGKVETPRKVPQHFFSKGREGTLRDAGN